jgi:PAS domain S-box-containing protein
MAAGKGKSRTTIRSPRRPVAVAGKDARGEAMKKRLQKPAARNSAKAGPGKPLKTGKCGPAVAKPCDLTLAVLEGAVEGIMIAERESGKIKHVNESICRMLGYSGKELLALTISDIHPAENLKAVWKAFAALHRNEIKVAASVPCRRKDKSVFWVDISTARVVVDGTPCIVGFFSDISEKKAARDENEMAQALFASVFNAVPDILGIQDTRHGIIRYNDAGYRFLHCDPAGVKGKKCFQLIGRNEPCTQCATSETYQTKQPAQLEKYVESLGVWMDVRSYPLFDHEGNLTGIVEHLRDITLQKRTDEEMLKAEKLESLSLLAGGIAHDFNNLLGGIYGYMELARSASQSPELDRYLDATLKTMNRAKGLTQQLLTFAKGGAPVRKPASLDGFLRETADFASSGSSISCALDIDADLWACVYDASQIGQVIANILINAQQAMPMGGTITMAAENATVGAGETHLLPAGRYVRISVRDKGVGIPREQLGRIFDPFFTTKQKGSGLGLATSYSIVKQHGGSIEVESQPGEGSTFHIYLPACEQIPGLSAADSAASLSSQGRILIMDDEEVVREMISAMLEHHGYDTVLAADGVEALRLFDENAGSGTPFSAVILDLTIRGGMGGKETIVEIRKRDPHIPAFVASGYADDAIVSRPREYGFTDSITKPFTRKVLIEILCRYL